jgi:hypothetical protein
MHFEAKKTKQMTLEQLKRQIEEWGSLPLPVKQQLSWRGNPCCFYHDLICSMLRHQSSTLYNLHIFEKVAKLQNHFETFWFIS